MTGVSLWAVIIHYDSLWLECWSEIYLAHTGWNYDVYLLYYSVLQTPQSKVVIQQPQKPNAGHHLQFLLCRTAFPICFFFLIWTTSNLDHREGHCSTPNPPLVNRPTALQGFRGNVEQPGLQHRNEHLLIKLDLCVKNPGRQPSHTRLLILIWLSFAASFFSLLLSLLSFFLMSVYILSYALQRELLLLQWHWQNCVPEQTQLFAKRQDCTQRICRAHDINHIWPYVTLRTRKDHSFPFIFSFISQMLKQTWGNFSLFIFLLSVFFPPWPLTYCNEPRKSAPESAISVKEH